MFQACFVKVSEMLSAPFIKFKKSFIKKIFASFKKRFQRSFNHERDRMKLSNFKQASHVFEARKEWSLKFQMCFKFPKKWNFKFQIQNFKFQKWY